MSRRRILVSWIGHNDLISAAAEADKKQQKRVLAALKIERRLPLRKQDGPIKSLLKQQSFDEVHLLGDYQNFLTRMFSDWLGFDVAIHPVSLPDPSDYGQILTAVEGVLGKLDHGADTEFSFFLTPGTPSMAATWILLGKSRYDAVFWQTYDGKATESLIPFDVVAGFASELAAAPDISLQHLVATRPREIEGFEAIAGSSKALRLAAGRAAKAARREVPILILGGTGSGKELFAEAIHNASRRNGKPSFESTARPSPIRYLRLNCSGTSKAHFLMPGRIMTEHSNRRAAALYFWTK